MRRVDTLSFDIEDKLEADTDDELTVTSLPASGSFDTLPSPCPEPYAKLVSLSFRLAARPLLC
jgi:hypothetical protein